MIFNVDYLYMGTIIVLFVQSVFSPKQILHKNNAATQTSRTKQLVPRRSAVPWRSFRLLGTLGEYQTDDFRVWNARSKAHLLSLL